MKTRREFLALSAAAAASIGMKTAWAESSGGPAPTLGVQLYTVRELLKNDPEKTLKAIHDIGFKAAESFVAEYSMSAKDLRTRITDAGLELPSAHFGYEDFGSRLEYGKELGVKYVVCSSLPRNMTTSHDGFKKGAEQYNAWGEQAKKMGMRFGFHNHNIEFQSFNGQTGVEILLKNTDPELVQWQMDCYWVTQAGHDPVKLLHEHGKRVQSLHVKDRKAGAQVSLTSNDKQNFTEVGRGTLNWKGIAREVRSAHIPYVFVEQDWTPGNPLDSIKISYAYLKKLFA